MTSRSRAGRSPPATSSATVDPDFGTPHAASPLLATYSPRTLLALECFQRMGRFPRDEEIPELVVDHVRRGLGLDAGVSAVYGSDRTRRHHRGLVRKRVGVVHNPARAREVAAGAIREAAVKMNNPPDLINVALETYPTQMSAAGRSSGIGAGSMLAAARLDHTGA